MINRTSGSATGRGVAWSFVAQFWTIGLSVLSTLILARLLSPLDYGLLAAILPLVGAAQTLQMLGFSTAIIQARDIDPPQLHTLFWVGLTVSLALTAAIMAVSAPLAALLNDHRLALALPVASLAVIASALAAQPSAILARNLEFRAIAIRNVISSTTAAILSIAIAAATRSYWALIVGLVAVPLLNFLLSVRLARWKPGRPGGDAGALVRFGLHVWAANFFTFTTRNADNLIVAYATNPRALGLYDRAYRLLLYPIDQAVAPLGNVLVPTLSRLRDAPTAYRDCYWRAVTLLLLICQPALLVAIAYPTTIIGLLLGPAWLDGAPVFAWFGGAGLFQVYLGTTAWLLKSQGRGTELMWLSLALALVALGSFLIGIRGGIYGLTVAYVVGQATIGIPATLVVTGRSGPIDHRDLARNLMPHLIALALTAMLIANARWAFGTPRWPALIGVTLLVYAVYAGVLASIHGSRRHLTDMYARVRDALTPAASPRRNAARRGL